MTNTQSFILCIETSGPVCSVALFDKATLLAYREASAPYSHSEKLTLMIQDVLEEAAVKAAQLAAVAVSKGPGSYTGLRIGTSVAKGFCYALDIPLLGIDTMLLLSHMAAEKDNTNEQTLIIPMTDARRMEVYCAVYNHHFEIVQPVHARIMDAQSFSEYEQYQLLLCGDGVAKCRELFESRPGTRFSAVTHPVANAMGALAFAKLDQKQFEDAAYFEPFYLKDFVATKPK